MADGRGEFAPHWFIYNRDSMDGASTRFTSSVAEDRPTACRMSTNGKDWNLSIERDQLVAQKHRGNPYSI